MSTLLTGATGFLGRHVLWDLLQREPLSEVHCLLRPSRRASPARRLEQLLKLSGDRVPPGARDRCHAVEGDITDEGLFAQPGMRRSLAVEVDRIIHAAASVMLETPLDEARRVNVEGTRNVLRFAEEIQASGQLRRVDHFSTAYVAGRSNGLALECDLPSTTFHNSYEQSKWESEQLVREYQRDLPIAIFRPSIIVGDSRTGYTSNFRVMYWPLKTLSSGLAIVVPLDAKGTVDLVPIDYVVDAFGALSASDRSLGKCYHLAAGPVGQSTCGELLDYATEFFGVRRPWLIPPQISYKIVRPLLYATIWGRRRRLLRRAEQYFPFFAYRTSFDTSELDADLPASEVKRPVVDEYFHTLLQYCVDSDWGAKRVPAA